MNKYKTLMILIWGLLLVRCGTDVAPAEPLPAASSGVTTVEIIYLNHGPVRPVLTEIDALLEDYGEQVHITRYDFGTPEGEAFAQARDLTGHTPLAIFINGSMEYTIDGRTIKFYSFPQGQGTGLAPDGAWTLDDLQQVLDQSVRKG